MTATIPAQAGPVDRIDASPASIGRGYRFELTKLLSLWRIRVLLLVCWIAPAVLVGVMSRQASLPSDTIFGRWMGQTGWAGALVVLSFACSWALPLLTSLVAGDVFAAEDRLGTWRHLLVTVRSPRRIFVAKALASATIILLLVVGLAASGIVGGLVSIGNRSLVGLSGQLVSPGHAAVLVIVSWVVVLAPTLAFAAMGLLGSVTLGRSPVGLAIPALVALAFDLAQLLPLPAVVRVALPSYAFIAWRGLAADPAYHRPLVVGLIVSLVWAALALALAYLLFLRRDFTDAAGDGLGRAALVKVAVPAIALIGVSIAGVAIAVSPSGSGITQPKLQASLSTAFAHLYRMQTRELNRPAVTEAQLGASATCDKGGSLVADEGAGNDWRCVVSWHLPGSAAVGSAIYQLDVTPDGRYVADGDGPQQVNGFFIVRTATGDAPNPLWQFDGVVDLLSSSKG